MANRPLVVITDADIAKEAFNKKGFSGRPRELIGASFISNDKHQDILYTDFGETWEALQKVTHMAVLKYSINDKLSYLEADCVDSTVKLMIENEGINKAFKPFDYISLLILNIISNSVFANNYSLNDIEFKKFNNIYKEFAKMAVTRQFLWEFSSVFRILDRNLIKTFKNDLEWLISITKNKFIDHYKDYSESIERDFCDALIAAKNNALRKGKESAHYLTDDNLGMCLFDLFGAGYDTTQYTFKWIILLLSYYPEIQNKLRQEIETQIGDRISTHEDRNCCHYVMAFIMESLRFRNVGSYGFPHKAMVRNNYLIPKGTSVIVHQGIILNDDKYWTNGHEFRPERFLKNGKLVTSLSKAFIPFGVGRRVCLGEKLAIAKLFHVLVRFLQMTSEYLIVLGQNNGLESDNNVFMFNIPYEYEIIFKTK